MMKEGRYTVSSASFQTSRGEGCFKGMERRHTVARAEKSSGAV